MGLWSSIKYAINSSLGTAGFKPLDRIISDKIKEEINSSVGTSEFKPLDQIVLGQKSLSASDNLYVTIENSEFGGAMGGTSNTVSDVFVSNWNGSLKIQTVPSDINIYKNGIKLGSGSKTTTCEKGDVFSVTRTASRVQIFADVVDLSAITKLGGA